MCGDGGDLGARWSVHMELPGKQCGCVEMRVFGAQWSVQMVVPRVQWGVCGDKGPRPALGVRALLSLSTTDPWGRIMHFRGAALGGCSAFSSGSGLCPLDGSRCPLMVTIRTSARVLSTGGLNHPSLSAPAGQGWRGG